MSVGKSALDQRFENATTALCRFDAVNISFADLKESALSAIRSLGLSYAKESDRVDELKIVGGMGNDGIIRAGTKSARGEVEYSGLSRQTLASDISRTNNDKDTDTTFTIEGVDSAALSSESKVVVILNQKFGALSKKLRDKYCQNCSQLLAKLAVDVAASVGLAPLGAAKYSVVLSGDEQHAELAITMVNPKLKAMGGVDAKEATVTGAVKCVVHLTEKGLAIKSLVASQGYADLVLYAKLPAAFAELVLPDDKKMLDSSRQKASGASLADKLETAYQQVKNDEQKTHLIELAEVALDFINGTTKANDLTTAADEHKVYSPLQTGLAVGAMVVGAGLVAAAAVVLTGGLALPVAAIITIAVFGAIGGFMVPVGATALCTGATHVDTPLTTTAKALADTSPTTLHENVKVLDALAMAPTVDAASAQDVALQASA